MALRVSIIALSTFLGTFLIVYDAYNGLLFILSCVDLYSIKTNYWIKISPDSSVKLAIGAEYYNLLFSLIIILARYIMHSIDTMREHPWDKKAMYLLYVEIVIGLLRLSMYIEFTAIMWKLHPFPLFVARPIYLSARSLKKAILDVYMCRRAIRYLNTIFQNATAADLAASSDTVCIICREEMQVAEEANGAPAGTSAPNTFTLKRLPCSHIFHTNCLLSWFQRQQTCPTCRMHVLLQPVNRQQEQQGRAAAAPVGASVSSASTGAGEANQAPAAGPNLPADFRPPWMISKSQPSFRDAQFDLFSNCAASCDSTPKVPGMPLPYFAFPQVPANDATAATGQPVQGQQVPYSYMFPHMYMQPPLVGMPMIYPGNLFPPLTSPMPVPPANGPDGLSDAQLRVSAIARFTALRQINVLLQAAVLQMNAYLNTVTDPNNLPPNDDFVTADMTVATASSDNTGASASREPTSPLDRTVGEGARSTPSTGLHAEHGPDADKSPSHADTSDASTPDSSQPGTSDEKDLIVIRNRWLEKIESQVKEKNADDEIVKTSN